jgi:protein dithiol oxidoreductase (disulfide-forming)
MKAFSLRAAAGAVALVALLAAAGCNDDNNNAASSQQASSTPAPLPAPTNAVSAPAARPAQSAASVAATHDLKPGQDYKVVSTPNYQAPADGKISVKEFFWYGCPHCYHALPGMERWINSGDSKLVFTFAPLPGNEAWAVGAQLNYALALQHLTEQDREAVFAAIHSPNGPHLSPSDKNGLIQWAGNNGWNAGQLAQDWDSFTVQSKVRADKAEADGLGLDGVPVVIVDGKYLIGIPEAMNAGFKEEQLADASQRVVKAIEDGKLAP